MNGQSNESIKSIYIYSNLIVKGYCDHRYLHELPHAYPTRRSSDLIAASPVSMQGIPPPPRRKIPTRAEAENQGIDSSEALPWMPARSKHSSAADGTTRSFPSSSSTSASPTSRRCSTPTG